MGPVQPTPSHAAAQPLGWDGFAHQIAGTRIPVYALGGLWPEDLATPSIAAHTASRCGAARGDRTFARRPSPHQRRTRRSAVRGRPVGMTRESYPACDLTATLGLRLGSSGSGGSSSSRSTAGIRYDSFAQAPKSISLHRSEQNGRHFASGVHSTRAPQVGHSRSGGCHRCRCFTARSATNCPYLPDGLSAHGLALESRRPARDVRVPSRMRHEASSCAGGRRSPGPSR